MYQCNITPPHVIQKQELGRTLQGMNPAGPLAEKRLYAAANVMNQHGHGHRTSEEFCVAEELLLMQKLMYRFAVVLKLVVST